MRPDARFHVAPPKLKRRVTRLEQTYAMVADATTAQDRALLGRETVSRDLSARSLKSEEVNPIVVQLVPRY